MSRLMATILAMLTVGVITHCGSPLRTTAPSLTAENAVGEVGQPAPEFSVDAILQAPSGTRATLAALKGKVVVLEFWATWCGPCIMAISHLNEVADRFSGRAVQFISVTDQKEGIVQEFLKKQPIRGRVGLDADRSMFRAYGVKGIPHTVLIDKDGKVVGFPSERSITKEMLGDMLAGRKPALPEWALKRHADEPSESKQEVKHPVYEVGIRPSNGEPGWGRGTISRGYRKLEGWTPVELVANAFDVSPTRVIAEAELPKGTYDVVVVAPDEREATVRRLLQSAIEMTFGVFYATENRDMDAYHLKLAPGGLKDGFKPTASTGGSGVSMVPGKLEAAGTTPAALARMLEDRLKTPTIDRTELKGKYDLELNVEFRDEAEVNNALRAQLGLELVPVREAVEVLVVKPAAPEKE